MNLKKIFTAISLVFSFFNANAAFIDDDNLCVIYGCVIVSDDNTSDVYDVYNGTTSVPIGSELIYNRGGPVVGTGTVDPLFTNTTTNISVMAAGQGTRIQITNQIAGGVFTYPASGILDASTTLTKFGIQTATKIDYTAAGTLANPGDNPQSHSFYITSRKVGFDIRATANLNSGVGDFATNVPGTSISSLLTLTPTGTLASNGQSFGTDTSNNYNFVNVAGLTLASLSTNPIVASFNGPRISSPSNPKLDIYANSVRLNAVYTLPAFSLAQGFGSLNWNIRYSFWRKN